MVRYVRRLVRRSRNLFDDKSGKSGMGQGDSKARQEQFEDRLRYRRRYRHDPCLFLRRNLPFPLRGVIRAERKLRTHRNFLRYVVSFGYRGRICKRIRRISYSCDERYGKAESGYKQIPQERRKDDNMGRRPGHLRLGRHYVRRLRFRSHRHNACESSHVLLRNTDHRKRNLHEGA